MTWTNTGASFGSTYTVVGSDDGRTLYPSGGGVLTFNNPTGYASDFIVAVANTSTRGVIFSI